MTTTFLPKDPAEDPIIEFDFEGELGPITGLPTVTAETVNGADPAVLAVLSGAVQVSGTSVFQRVDNGLSGINYKLRCEASDGTTTRVRTAILPVRRE